MANLLDSNTVISKFKLQLWYYIHFWTDTLGEKYKPIYPSKLYYYSSSMRMTDIK